MPGVSATWQAAQSPAWPSSQGPRQNLRTPGYSRTDGVPHALDGLITAAVALEPIWGAVAWARGTNDFQKPRQLLHLWRAELSTARLHLTRPLGTTPTACSVCCQFYSPVKETLSSARTSRMPPSGSNNERTMGLVPSASELATLSVNDSCGEVETAGRGAG